LDAIEGLQASYELQVSSPGLDRPIRSDDDIRRNTGREVRLESRDDTGRVVEHHGVLAGTGTDGSVRVVTTDGEVAVARDRILLMKQTVSPSGTRHRKP
jgi:ribosome maturation factor RimP